ncbi:MAG TPA: 2-dehydropantoate 2-reductase [Vicinamibacterales bacterium]|jgi:2-dehydropantoate 2-reductase|nr:2-dehydropantoate 2-reductase [Vicinamibacterales bacterium]
MHFVILGSGGVGGYYGAKLARAGHHVTLIARGAHLAAIRERGLEIVAPDVESFTVRVGGTGAPGQKIDATDDPRKAGTPDLVILAVKTYDNPAVLPMLQPMLGPATAVLTLQNGVDSPDEVAAAVGEDRVLAGPTYIATALESPGRIVQTGTHRRIVFGEVFGARGLTDRVRAISDAMTASDIKAEPVEDARAPLWEKFIYLAPFAGFTGAMRLPAGAIMADRFIHAQFFAAAAEVERVARAEGVALPADLEARLAPYTNALPPSTRSSLLIDLSQGRRIEVEALQGSVVRRGARGGVPTPIMSTLYAVLKPYAEGTPAR